MTVVLLINSLACVVSQNVLSETPFQSDLPRGLLFSPPSWVREAAPHLQELVELCSSPSRISSEFRLPSNPSDTNKDEVIRELIQDSSEDSVTSDPKTRKQVAWELEQLLNLLLILIDDNDEMKYSQNEL